MATTGVTNGHYMRFFDNGVSLGYATECSISFSMSPRELAHKDTAGDGGGWVEQAAGQKSGTWSTSGLYAEDDNAASALYTKFANGTILDLTFTTDEVGDKIWTSQGLITSLEISAPNNENVVWSASGTFNGEVIMGTVS